jgi:hypothetical protein
MQVAGIDDDHDPILPCRKAARLGKVAARLLELDLPIDGVKDPIVRAGIDKDDRCRATYLDNNINETIDYSPARFLLILPL